MGNIEEAEHEYKPLGGYYPGPEAKCRYALMLKEVGRVLEAKEIFQEIVTMAKHSPRHYKKLHKSWITIATQEIE